ncbi:MAG: 4Fe-4S binding protein [Bradyrhizobium sp.]
MQRVTAAIMAGRGDELPVSAMPVDGTFPLGTAAWEKRNISDEVPIWETDSCIQCGQCALACPHSVIRAKFYDGARLMDPGEPVPPTFSLPRSTPAAIPTAFSLCNSTWRIAPDAAFASRFAQRIALPCPAPKPSIWRQRRRCLRLRGKTSHFSRNCQSTTAPRWISPMCAASSSLSHFLSSPGPAPAAGKRLICGCCPSYSGTACKSPMRPAAPRSTAAICRSRPGRRIARVVARPGRTRCLRTMPNSASASVSPPICTALWRRVCCTIWRRGSASHWPKRSLLRPRFVSPKFSFNAGVLPS